MAIANVLLVDDEVPFVETVTKRLNKRDVQVSTAFSGAEALEKLGKERNLEVVILDVKMPGMDGIETLKEIKPKYPLVEVVMLTGHATVETAIEGMKLGAFDYLMKPCDMDGIEVLKVFKKMVPSMPVIMLTGHGSEKAARDGLELGASGYLTKPCDLEELMEKIKEAIRSVRS